MYRSERFHRLDLDHNKILNQQIDSIPQFEFRPSIHNRQTNLRRRLKTRCAEFELQAGCVRAFEEPGPQFRMNAHGSSDDRAADFLCGKPMK